MEAFILSLVAKYPIASTAVMVIGTMRVVMKPLISLARAYVQSTANPADDKMLDTVEASPVMKGFLYVLDWFGSIKLVK